MTVVFLLPSGITLRYYNCTMIKKLLQSDGGMTMQKFEVTQLVQELTETGWRFVHDAGDTLQAWVNREAQYCHVRRRGFDRYEVWVSY